MNGRQIGNQLDDDSSRTFAKGIGAVKMKCKDFAETMEVILFY